MYSLAAHWTLSALVCKLLLVCKIAVAFCSCLHQSLIADATKLTQTITSCAMKEKGCFSGPLCHAVNSIRVLFPTGSEL